MENEFDGTLFIKGEGKKRKLYLRFTTRNNKNWENPINEAILSPGLKAFAQEKEEPEKAVKLQEQGGRPIAVYLEGETEIIKQELPQADYGKKSSVPEANKLRFRKDDGFKSGKSEEEAENLRSEFHNPYNFVPAIPREDLANGLEDSAPVGHDRFHENYFSGKLTVRMTVETPLLVLDTSKVEIDENDHKSYPVCVDSKGKPFINPTAVKGMLRSAYEAVTNSRMSVFTKHEERLAFRMESTEGAMSVPARIENGKIVLYTGKTKIDKKGKPTDGVLCAAWIKTYDKRICRLDRTNGIQLCDVKRPAKHGEEVFALISKKSHPRKPFSYWKVEKMALKKDKLGSISEGQILVKGYVCVTGRNQGNYNQTGPNIENKHDERLFFNENNSCGFPKFDLKTVEDKWNDLIKNYRIEHDNGKGGLEEAPKAKRKRQNGEIYEVSLQWSRHIRQTTKSETESKSELRKEKLVDGSLLYVRLGEDLNGKPIVQELYPVMISRRLHEVPPESLLDKSLKPAKSISELSPADRVFGWVNQKGSGAYRGQIRIGSIVCCDEDAIQEFKDGLPLNILGQPKPQQGRFYVAETPKGEAQTEKRNNENAGYKARRGLRGRKVYPHHANLPNDYWITEEDWRSKENSEPNRDLTQTLLGKKHFREYIRPKQEKRFDNQNRSIKGWVKPGTVFEFDIHFMNLSKVELGALIWLLQLPDGHFHRFGGGKPYGFGSVKLEITESDVRKGNDWKTFYESLDDQKIGKLDEDKGEDKIEEIRREFDKLANSKFPKIIKSFLRACEGFSDKPIHYPRNSPKLTADTKSFEWFVANNKIERGNVKCGYVLQDLANDNGLPYLD
jgi:CRISPR-associated protein